MAHFLCHLGCSHFGALLLDFYFTENSYKKLWKLLIDKDMKKRDLERCAGISHYTINKLNHGENVTTDILGKICKALGCTMNDIMEFIDDDSAQ